MKEGEYEELTMRLESLEEEIEVVHSRIDAVEDMIKETRQMLVSIGNSHAALVKMNEILAKKLLEKKD